MAGRTIRIEVGLDKPTAHLVERLIVALTVDTAELDDAIDDLDAATNELEAVVKANT